MCSTSTSSHQESRLSRRDARPRSSRPSRPAADRAPSPLGLAVTKSVRRLEFAVGELHRVRDADRRSTRHLLPIFTIGRYFEPDGRTVMPLAVHVHHASAEGFHTARLVDDIPSTGGGAGVTGVTVGARRRKLGSLIRPVETAALSRFETPRDSRRGGSQLLPECRTRPTSHPHSMTRSIASGAIGTSVVLSR